jgi:uncharacterized membrane protein YphA (DoxX/SURF4 family)
MSVTQLPESTPYAPADFDRPLGAPDGSPAPAKATPAAPAEWSAAKRIGFRFLFSYFVLYLFPFPIGAIPGSWNPAKYWGQLDQWLSLWTETHLFGLPKPVPIVPTGSGDTMAQWASQVNWILLAAAATIVWTILDRKRREYARLSQWLHVYVRFGLATIMFSYGLGKVIPTQMQRPTLERLVEPWGEFSPMGVLWSFMGFSNVYQIFTGIGEALGSLLIVFRRTTTLGALLLCGVLANVALLNYTFDVPVKLFSTNLLLMAVFLAAPDAKRLVDVFVLNRPAAPRPVRPLFATRRATVIAAALATLFVGYTIFTDVKFGLTYYRQTLAPDAPKPPVYGIWDVESLTKNGVDQPPLLSDSTRIRRVIFGGLSRATFRLMSDSVERYLMKVDSVKHELALTGRFDPKDARVLSYTKVDPNHLVLTGKLGADSLVMRLRRYDENRFLLMNRGFHWIQELPFNR